MQKLHLSKRVNIKSNLLLHKMMQIFPFPPRIKLKRSYYNYYGSSFYQFQQLELFICTSTSIFKHFLYATMSYISNTKISCNFITPSFQHTQLQYFCSEIPQQRAGYSTSMSNEYVLIFPRNDSILIVQNAMIDHFKFLLDYTVAVSTPVHV